MSFLPVFLKNHNNHDHHHQRQIVCYNKSKTTERLFGFFFCCCYKCSVMYMVNLYGKWEKQSNFIISHHHIIWYRNKTRNVWNALNYSISRRRRLSFFPSSYLCPDCFFHCWCQSLVLCSAWCMKVYIFSIIIIIIMIIMIRKLLFVLPWYKHCTNTFLILVMTFIRTNSYKKRHKNTFMWNVDETQWISILEFRQKQRMILRQLNKIWNESCTIVLASCHLFFNYLNALFCYKAHLLIPTEIIFN